MGKYASKDEAKTALTSAKEEKKAARTELRAFEKENGLEHEADHSGNAKVGKKWAKLSETLKNKTGKVDKIQAEVEGFKKEKTVRPSKYEYPQVEEGGKKRDMTAAEKKRFRASARAKVKSAEKGESKKSSKKADKKAEGKGSEKSSKKSGKKKEKSEKPEKEAAAIED